MTANSASGGGSERVGRVMRFTLGAIALGLVSAFGRVVQLQTAPPEPLRPFLNAGVRSHELPGVRGDIVDVRGRILSTTHFGTRLVIDPHLFPADPHEAIAEVCEAAGLDPGEVGPRVLRAQAENFRRAALREQLAREQASEQTAGSPVASLLMASAHTVGATSLAGAATPGGATSDGSPGEGLAEEPAASGDPESAAPPNTRTIRYTPVSEVLAEERVAALRVLQTRKEGAIPGLVLERVPIRAYPGGLEIAPLIGLVGQGDNGDFDQGKVGAEASFEDELTGPAGRVRFVQDAKGAEMWIDTTTLTPAGRGQDLRLSIDLEIQRMALEELRRGVEDAEAAGGRIIVLDPATGDVLAMGDIIRPIPGTVPYPWTPTGSQERLPPIGQRPRYHVFPPEPQRDLHPAIARQRCVVDSYEPGSTFKPFVWAIALSEGVVRLDEIIDTGGGAWRPRPGRLVQDVRTVRAASRSWHDVLVYSSNVGMSRVALRVAPRILHDTLARWGFGQRLDIGLPYQPRGQMTSMKDWKLDTTVSVSFGYEVLVTPLHMVRAFSAFARQGELAGTIPTVSLLARPADDPQGDIVERVLSPQAALAVRGPLEIVAQRMERHVRDTPEGGWRYRIFGKSGTANVPLGAPSPGFRRPLGERGYFEDQYNSSFIAAGPVERPRLVILCIIDDPGPSKIRVEQHYGSYVAGPVVRRVFERALEYLAVPPSLPVEAEAATPR